MSIKHQAFRIAKYAYNAVPEKARGQVEVLFAPITFRLATRGTIKKNESLGNPPYKPVSIVIPSYNDFRLLKKLIKSIEKTCSDFQYEIIISDDFCELENTKLLRTLESDRVQIIEGESRKGFAGAVNRGLAKARWDVVLLNSDIIALPFWLENLQAAAYNIDPKIGLVSPHLLYPTGRIQYGGTFHATVVAPQWFAHLDQGRYANYPSANVGKYVVAISGACVYIKKEVLELEPRFDEEYWLGFEDVDYAFAVRKHGFRAYIEPSSKLIHLESATRGKVQGAKEYASMQKFWAKWGINSQTIQEPNQIVYLLSKDSPKALNAIAESLSRESNAAGFSASICFVNTSSRLDEHVISKFEHSGAVMIALDVPSLETAWLTGVQSRKIFTLFPDAELSGLSEQSSQVISLLKPEFSYLIANKQLASQISKLMPWGVSHVNLLPVFGEFASGPESLEPSILLAGEDFSTELIELIDKANFKIPFSFCSEKHLYELLDNKSPVLQGAIIVLLNSQLNNFLGSSLMNAKAAVIYPSNMDISFEFLDGYNSFSFPQKDLKRMIEIVSWLVHDQNLRVKTIENGSSFANEILSQFPKKLQIALRQKRF